MSDDLRWSRGPGTCIRRHDCAIELGRRRVNLADPADRRGLQSGRRTLPPAETPHDVPAVDARRRPAGARRGATASSARGAPSPKATTVDPVGVARRGSGRTPRAAPTFELWRAARRRPLGQRKATAGRTSRAPSQRRSTRPGRRLPSGRAPGRSTAPPQAGMAPTPPRATRAAMPSTRWTARCVHGAVQRGLGRARRAHPTAAAARGMVALWVVGAQVGGERRAKRARAAVREPHRRGGGWESPPRPEAERGGERGGRGRPATEQGARRGRSRRRWARRACGDPARATGRTRQANDGGAPPGAAMGDARAAAATATRERGRAGDEVGPLRRRPSSEAATRQAERAQRRSPLENVGERGVRRRQTNRARHRRPLRPPAEPGLALRTTEAKSDASCSSRVG